MRLEIAADHCDAAGIAANQLAGSVRDAVAARGSCVIAFSGGSTPQAMLQLFAGQDLPWAAIHVFQVDERIAPAGTPARNLTGLEQQLVREGPLAADHLHAMPVEQTNLARACADYGRELAARAGATPVLDLVQLGLGADGHTASLFPGDAALEERDDAVAISGEYAGYRRLTLTLPVLDRARTRLWLVTGSAKATRLAELVEGRGKAPALRVSRQHAVVICDAAAAAALNPAGA